MLKKIGINSISDILNWILTFSNKFDKETPEAIKQRLPGFLGLSLEDERIFAGLRTNLNKTEDMYLTDFLNSCKDYEKNRFRNVVAGMPVSKEEISTGTGKDKRTVKKEVHSGVKFLRRIATLVRDYGPEEAYRRCLSGHIIVRDPVHQKVLKQWRKSTEWFRKKILDALNVRQLSDINFSQLANDLAQATENYLETKKQAQKNRPLWKRMLW